MTESGIIKSEDIDILLSEIDRHYGYDFSQYSRASLTRRINRICLLDRFDSVAALRYRVVNDAGYLQRFIEEVTVNVTAMFRDPSFYAALRTDILPRLASYPLIRIWIAGCSTGEEAYSLAILLREAGLYHKSLVYATDINPGSLEKASLGLFPLGQMEQYEANYTLTGGTENFAGYYAAKNDTVKFDPALAARIIFSTHNLVSDSSFNEFQLILCRNVLIYFDKDLQNKVFRLFDESLRRLGYLALGTKETVRFSPLEQRYQQIGAEKIWKKLK